MATNVLQFGSGISEKNDAENAPGDVVKEEADIISQDIRYMGGGCGHPSNLRDVLELYRVEFDGPNDPSHPHNWSPVKKLVACFSVGYGNLSVAFGSAIYASGIMGVAQEYDVGNVTATLGITLYVFGFASGPVLWGPLSEQYGRKIPMVVGLIGFTVFTFGAASAKDLQTVLLCRFFAGFFGASLVVVVAAVIADMFNLKQRGTALTIYTGTVFCGPLVAPVLGGFIVDSRLGWRWTQYITGIMGSASAKMI